MISILIGTLGTVPKGLVSGLEESEIRGQIETIETDSSERPSANACVKNSQGLIIIIIIIIKENKKIDKLLGPC